MRKNQFFQVNRLLLGICIIGVFLSASGCQVNEEFQRTVDLSELLGPGRRFEADTHNGSISAAGAETKTCDISATIIGRGPTVNDARQVAESIEIRLETADDKLVVHIDKPALLDHQYFSVDYAISLPKMTSIEFHTHNGGVNVSTIKGNVYSTTHNGSIQVEKITGAVRLSTHNGGIDCYDVLGKVDARTHNGDVNVHYSDQSSDTLDADITTHNGAIEIKAPEKLSAELNVSTHNGLIKVSMPVTVTGEIDKKKLRGKIGTGLGNMSLHTHNGSITIR